MPHLAMPNDTVISYSPALGTSSHSSLAHLSPALAMTGPGRLGATPGAVAVVVTENDLAGPHTLSLEPTLYPQDLIVYSYVVLDSKSVNRGGGQCMHDFPRPKRGFIHSNAMLTAAYLILANAGYRFQ